jgi:hypothetical protein
MKPQEGERGHLPATGGACFRRFTEKNTNMKETLIQVAISIGTVVAALYIYDNWIKPNFGTK